MADLIDRQVAIKEVGFYSCHSGDKLLFADNKLKQLPSVDAVEVVRCKDCKYWLPHKQLGYDYGRKEYHNYCKLLVPEDEYYAFPRNANDYCSRGERKDGRFN